MNRDKSINVGVAAHITAASPGGPRYAPNLLEEQRSSADNGIWLCQNCAKLMDNDTSRFTVAVIREWKLRAEEAALEQLGKTFPSPVNRLTPSLSAKLRAPAPERDPEMVALEIIVAQAKFYMRVIQLIDDISRLPEHKITHIARPPSYDNKKQALYEKFNEEYTRFMSDMERALDLLQTVEHRAGSRSAEIAELLKGAATTVGELVDWAEDPRNDPIHIANIHPAVNPNAKVGGAAREASIRLMRAAGQRLLELRAG